MSIKKFIISTGDGDLEESELDSSGQRTIGYDDVEQRVQLSKAYVVGDLYVSGSIIGNLTGSVNGNASGGGGASVANTVKFTKSVTALSVGDVVSISANGLSRCNYSDSLLSNVIGVVYASASNEVEVQTYGEIEISTIFGTCTTGSVLFAGAFGSGATYDQIPSGGYITQIGYISGNGPNKLIIQPRVFGIKG